MNLRYTERAQRDLRIAFDWYENQRIGLGHHFLDCVEVQIVKISNFPRMYPIAFDEFRRSVIRRFPFSIFYTIEEDEIVIHSVFDNRQDPESRPPGS